MIGFNRIILVGLFFGVVASRALGVPATTAPSSQPVESQWNGYRRIDFAVQGRAALLVMPHRAAAGNPWIWRTEFFGVEPQADLALLSRGFAVAYLNVQNMYGAPVAMGFMDGFYDFVTREYGLSSKTVLEGFSRGGLFALNYGITHPERVAAMYLDAPVCDFKSWPGGQGKSPRATKDWQRLLLAYGMNEAAALTYKGNPIDNLSPLAAAQVPMICVIGNADRTAIPEENALLLERRYQQLGGSILVIRKPFGDHHPHSLADPSVIVNFVVSHTVGPATTAIKIAGTPFGYDYHVPRGGTDEHGALDNCRIRFERDKVGRVVFLGGSITAMKGWRDLVCADLARRFPETRFTFVNAGIPSMGSTPGAFRFSRDVTSGGPVDLLFEEAAVNDDVNGVTATDQIRGMEGIVRQARIANPLTDVVMLDFVDPPMLDVLRQGQTPPVIASHERVAAAYGVPSLNLAQEVAERIAAGEFTWDHDFKSLHPSPFGMGVYARSIGRMLDEAWSAPLAADATPLPHLLPKPIDADSYFRAKLVPPDAAEGGDGWTLVAKWHPSDGVHTRPGFVDAPALVAEQPGATLHLNFTGTAVGIFVAAGPDAGEVEYCIDDGVVKTVDLYTQWSKSLHLPWAVMLASDCSDGPHRLMLRVASGHNAASRGTAVRIFHFLVNGTANRETGG